MTVLAQTATNTAQTAAMWIAAGILLANAVLVFLVFVQVRAAKKSLVADHERTRKQATLAHFMALNQRNLERMRLLASELGRDEPIPIARVRELHRRDTEEKDLRDAIRAFLNDLEYLAVGTNLGILDADVLDHLANTSIRDAADKYQYWIAEARARGSPTMYSHLVALAEDFEGRYNRRMRHLPGDDGQIIAPSRIREPRRIRGCGNPFAPGTPSPHGVSWSSVGLRTSQRRLAAATVPPRMSRPRMYWRVVSSLRWPSRVEDVLEGGGGFEAESGGGVSEGVGCALFDPDAGGEPFDELPGLLAGEAVAVSVGDDGPGCPVAASREAADRTGGDMGQPGTGSPGFLPGAIKSIRLRRGAGF